MHCLVNFVLSLAKQAYTDDLEKQNLLALPVLFTGRGSIYIYILYMFVKIVHKTLKLKACSIQYKIFYLKVNNYLSNIE